MIGYLEGKVIYTDSENVCLLLCSGVGYNVRVSKNVMAKSTSG